MKFIPANDVSLEHALRISSDHSSRQILRIALDRYAVVDMQNAKLITAFESKKFSALINTLKQPIKDIELIATRPLLSWATNGHPSAGTTFEIRMYLGDAYGITFHSSETTYSFIGPPTQSIVEESSSPAAEHWHLPDIHPYELLLVTPEYVRWVNQMSTRCQPDQILKRCHLDYCQQHRESSLVNPGKRIYVDGEFGPFVAIEYLCGRICFHSHA